MVFTLHRYIFRELFKVFLLTAVALTLILSLGSILRPVQEYGVGPRQIVYLMGYFLPIILTFVLPMAALFASTLVYGRFASDNELNACRASGVWTLTLVYPGVALAIIVAIANLLLSFHVMPEFVHRAEKALKADAKQILFRNIQRRGFYELPESQYLIYADRANQETNMLSGVIVTKVKDNRVKEMIIAEKAKIDFDPHKNFNEVRITAYDTYQMAPDKQGGFYIKRVPIRASVPSLLADDIKFKKIEEMKRIRVDLMRFYPIEKMARDVYAQYVTELLAQSICGKLNSEEKASYELLGEPNSVSFTADECSLKEEEQILLNGNVLVAEFNTDSRKTTRTFTADRAILHIEGDKLSPTLTLDVYSPMWRRADGAEGYAQRRIIRGLLLPVAVTRHFQTRDVLDSISRDKISKALVNGPTPGLKDLQRKLTQKIRMTLADIKAEMHTRLVFGIGCVPMILIGIGLGVFLRGGHPLTAFGVSCIPAALLIVGVLAGKNITKNLGSEGVSGVVVMWSAFAFLVFLVLIIYRKLLKS